MAHWAEINENNIVVRVTVGNNEDLDEGYQWLIDNLGGRWIKCSYNTYRGTHNLGGTPLRWTFPFTDYLYIEDLDIFVEPSPYPSWLLDKENKIWKAPKNKPDSGLWYWSESSMDWLESNNHSAGEEQNVYYNWLSTQR